MNAPITETPWKFTLNIMIYIWLMLGLFEETILLGPPFPTFPLARYLWDSELNTLTIAYSSSDQSTSLAKAQGPIYNLGPLSLQILFWDQCQCSLILMFRLVYSRLIYSRFKCVKFWLVGDFNFVIPFLHVQVQPPK